MLQRQDPARDDAAVRRDDAAVRKRAMESLFERLESLCEGAIAINRDGKVVYVNEKYLPTLGLASAADAIGHEIEEIIPNSLMRQVAETGEPILLDIMELGRQQLVVTRMPIEDEHHDVIGAIGFVLYDRLDHLKPLMERFARLENELRSARRQLAQERRPRYTLDDYIGASAPILEAKRLAGRSLRQDITVLLLGETGTGKELLAQAIHNGSARAEKPFVSVNVAAIPDTLMESEFFGAAPGAYTGADRKGRDGKLKIADGGTLFLDEIGEMPLHLQSKLLRALQEQEIEPLGSNKVLTVDLRVIAATNADLAQRVKEGRFRADLYYRLNVLSIALPPLRDCLDDLAPICDYLLDRMAAKIGSRRPQLTPSALAALARYDWPGNVRELNNVLERALILSDSHRLTGEDFAGFLPHANKPVAAAPKVSLRSYAEEEAEFERRTLDAALKAAAGQISDAAKLLGISRATFYKKLAKVGMRVPA